MSNVHLGTCSWKYDSWRGLIYPEKGKINFLQEYARHYSTVEIDQWFWSLFTPEKVKLPETKVVEEYLNSVPSSFKFTVKVPNSITLTHFYQHGKTKGEQLRANPYFLSIDLFDEFLGRIEPLRKQIGVLMFQFEYLNKKKMTSQKEFFNQLSSFIEKSSKNYPYAIEIRNPNYLNQDYFEHLNQLRLFFVFVHGYYMPSIITVYNKFSTYIKEKTVIRLMGRDRKKIEKQSKNQWDQIVDSKDDELEDIIQIIKDLELRQVEVYLNINNHYEGSAPLTINKIREML
jgi:uncharacterized protein YecE (DUF72 family)